MKSPDRDTTNEALKAQVEKIRKQKKIIQKRLIRDITEFNHSVTRYSIANE